MIGGRKMSCRRFLRHIVWIKEENIIINAVKTAVEAEKTIKQGKPLFLTCLSIGNIRYGNIIFHSSRWNNLLKALDETFNTLKIS